VLETLLKPTDTEERCGLLLAGNSLVEVKNIANDPVMGYLMDPEEVLPYLTNSMIVGTWHTHPNGSAQLSGEDFKGFLAWPQLVHYVIGRDGVKCYKVENGAVLECD
jgi:proteasome lid subunit RPN8/RPN11